MKKLITLVLTLALCIPMLLTNSVEAKANDGEVIVGNGQTITEGTYDGFVTVKSGGTIAGGTFNGRISVESGGTIAGGTFEELVSNIGTISNGTFKRVDSAGRITGGTFNGYVWNGIDLYNNYGTITSGEFYGTVANHGGIIENGEFYGTVNNGNVDNSSGRRFGGEIRNGLFYGTVNINGDGRIEGGTFNNIVNNTGLDNNIGSNVVIDPTLVPNNGNQGNNTPQPSPNPEGNVVSNNNNQYVVDEPVVIIVPEGQVYVDNVMEQLSMVPTDGKVVIDTKDWYCFNRTLAEKVTNMEDVTVTIKYKYQGKRYEVTIPAGSDVVSLLGETGFVGFRYLDAVFGGREIQE